MPIIRFTSSAPLLYALLVSTPAVAAPPPEARELKSRGDAAMDAGRYADALDHYRQAYAATQSPALLYNMGRAYQRLGHYTEALAYFEQFDRVATPDLRSRVPRLEALMAEIRSHLATLTVKCNVVGARVLVRGKWVGTTPLRTPLLLMAGAADVEIDADGYVPQKKQLMLVEGRASAVVADLAPAAQGGKLARLVVRSPVSEGNVCVDASCLGRPPVTVPVEAGMHRIVFRAPGYKDAETSTMLSPGQSKEVLLDPARVEEPITKKWWFWTGMGVVVVGGIGAAVLLTRDPEAPSGDIAPGQISAPLVRF